MTESEKFQTKIDAACRAADDLAAADSAFRAAHKVAGKAYSYEGHEAFSKYMDYIDNVLPPR